MVFNLRKFLWKCLCIASHQEVFVLDWQLSSNTSAKFLDLIHACQALNSASELFQPCLKGHELLAILPVVHLISRAIAPLKLLEHFQYCTSLGGLPTKGIK